jgi:transcriptional regulator with XRE-family HTH domain
MDARKPSPGAGERLKAVRVRLGLTTRDVERKSQQIAEEKRNQEYYLSHAWLTDIENGEFTPSIYKLYSLSAIYYQNFTELLSTILGTWRSRRYHYPCNSSLNFN